MLQDDPVYLDKRTVVGNYDNLNQGKNGFLYNYSISCWFWINPQPPSQSASTTVYTSILNYGNIPNITYMGAQNTLRITMKDQDSWYVNQNRYPDHQWSQNWRDNSQERLYLRKENPSQYQD